MHSGKLITDLLRDVDKRLIAGRAELLAMAARLRIEAELKDKDAEVYALEGDDSMAEFRRKEAADLLRDAANFCLMAKCKECNGAPCSCDGA